MNQTAFVTGGEYENRTAFCTCGEDWVPRPVEPARFTQNDTSNKNLLLWGVRRIAARRRGEQPTDRGDRPSRFGSKSCAFVEKSFCVFYELFGHNCILPRIFYEFLINNLQKSNGVCPRMTTLTSDVTAVCPKLPQIRPYKAL